jgi:hypothetical protein
LTWRFFINIGQRNRMKCSAHCDGANFEECLLLEILAVEAKASFDCVLNGMHDLR